MVNCCIPVNSTAVQRFVKLSVTVLWFVARGHGRPTFVGSCHSWSISDIVSHAMCDKDQDNNYQYPEEAHVRIQRVYCSFSRGNAENFEPNVSKESPFFLSPTRWSCISSLDMLIFWTGMHNSCVKPEQRFASKLGCEVIIVAVTTWRHGTTSSWHSPSPEACWHVACTAYCCATGRRQGFRAVCVAGWPERSTSVCCVRRCICSAAREGRLQEGSWRDWRSVLDQTQTQTQTHLFKQDCRKSITTYLSCAPVRRE